MQSNASNDSVKAKSSDEENSSDEEAVNVGMEPQSSASDKLLMVKTGVDRQPVP